MTFKYFTCTALVLMATPAFAKGSVTLVNGDRLSGDIVQQSDTTITFKTVYGTLEIPRSDIEDINSGFAKKPVTISMTVPEELLPIKEEADVAAIRPAAGKNEEVDTGLWGALWSGNANLGASLKTGNSKTSGINIDATAKAKWDKHRAEVSVVFNREEDDGNVSVNNRSIAGAHSYFFKDKWFWENALKFEQDDIDQIDLRMQYNSGLGYQFYDRDDFHLKVVAGPGYQYEEFEDGSDESDATFHARIDYDQKFYDDLFRVFHRSDLSVPVADSEDFLFQSKNGIRIPLKKGIIASFEIGFDWDNQPASGTTEDDISYVFKLGYEW